MRILIIFFMGCLMVAMPSAIQANVGWQNHDSILAAARQHLAQQINNESFSIEMQPLDPRLQLAVCQQPLLVSVPTHKRLLGHVVVHVKCPDLNSWQTYINATVQAVQTLVVAVRAIPRGSQIQAADLALLRWPAHQLRGAGFLKLEEVVGLTAKTALAAQEPVLSSQVCMVCKGDNVQLSAGDERFSVGISGVAHGYANLGESVSVLNPRSRRVVSGIVKGPGLVRIGGR